MLISVTLRHLLHSLPAQIAMYYLRELTYLFSFLTHHNQALVLYTWIVFRLLDALDVYPKALEFVFVFHYVYAWYFMFMRGTSCCCFQQVMDDTVYF